MELSTKIMSDIVTHMKYAKYLPSKHRRETFEEIVTRNKEMHIKKFPQLMAEIDEAYELVYQKKILPSGRSLQFAGKAIEMSPARIYNCSAIAVSDSKAFSEIMFLLLMGCGVGYSVQKHHVRQLPAIIGAERAVGNKRKKRYLVQDSIVGWADAVKAQMDSYFEGTLEIDFDYRDIRKKGATLKTSGGKAPGAEPLRICLDKIDSVLRNAVDTRGSGCRLTTLEAHDIICLLADAVLCGGVRRSACISLFSLDDTDMLECKFGNWWELNPHRGRANNSAVIDRSKITREVFDELWGKVQASGSGEPGVFFTNDVEMLTNPCCEIALPSHSFCNLVTINASSIVSQDDYNYRAKMAARIATLQASYTDFYYLRKEWRENVERDALIGVSMTGVASDKVMALNMIEASKIVVQENNEFAKKLGINPSKRSTCLKPEGTSSIILGTSSGVHAWYAPYYWRRVSVGKEEAIYQYLSVMHPELIEDDYFKPTTMAKRKVPQKAPEGAMLRTVTALDTMKRVKKISTDWITEGHVEGVNHNNVSCTISVRDNEWEEVGNWMWDNKDHYNGIAVLPYDGGSYTQSPFEECTKEEYENAMRYLSEVDLTQVIEGEDLTDFQGEVACGGGACEIK